MYFAQAPHQKKIWGIRTSDVEIHELLKAWFFVSLAFTILLNGFSFGLGTGLIFIIAATTVGTGFLLHELMHKLVAQYYHCWAEFRADNMMLLFAVFSSFMGFLFAAPGAVMIYGPHITPRQNGIISAVGPLTNYIFALFFLLISALFLHPFVLATAKYGFLINSWLGIFNMIPFMNFDGAKIFKWNYFVWGGMVCLGIGLLVLKIVLFGSG
ncbi:metalloprotease [Candidatus Woesearchaeota archaeon]|nr:metalloprotease [Candidatus Woesearchaeota archaeon]